MPSPQGDYRPNDDDLIELIGRVLDEDAPVPAGAVHFASEAFAWRDVDAELAELLHDSVLEEAVAVHDETACRLMMFQAGALTLDLEQNDAGLTGAVSPAGRYRVVVQRGGSPAGAAGQSSELVTDEAGMFELHSGLDGPVRLVVNRVDGTGSLVSPWVTF